MDRKQQIDDVIRFLQENSTAVVATAYKNDPKVSTVYFVSDDDLNFYFATKRKTSKYINASLNPKASVVVGTGPEHISVQAHGEIELVVNEVEYERVINLLVGKQNLKGVKVWPIDELKNYRDSHKVIFKIIPDELFFMNLDAEKHKDSQSDKFIKII
jgi:general stress protein 26